MSNDEPRTSNLEPRTRKSCKPPKATTKPYSRHILGIDSGVQSHPKATPKPPPSHHKAPPQPPPCDPKATPKPGNREGIPCASVVLLWRYRSHHGAAAEPVDGSDGTGLAGIQMKGLSPWSGHMGQTPHSAAKVAEEWLHDEKVNSRDL